MSVAQAVAHVGANPIVSSDPEIVAAADKIIVPGVGAFAVAMSYLEGLELDKALSEAVSRGTPLLGICLGMQLLFSESLEFGRTAGLNFIPGTVRRVVEDNLASTEFRATHIGWRGIDVTDRGIGLPLFAGRQSGDAFYFVHSYSAHSSELTHTLATVDYAGGAVAAVVGVDNILGVQFHPEKSGSAGLTLLGNFCEP